MMCSPNDIVYKAQPSQHMTWAHSSFYIVLQLHNQGFCTHPLSSQHMAHSWCNQSDDA